MFPELNKFFERYLRKEPMFWGYLIYHTALLHLGLNPDYSFRSRNVQKKLVNSVRDAGKNVPFYRDLYRKVGIDIQEFSGTQDLKKLPLVTKDDIRSAFPDRITREGTNLDRCIHSATTGSTGKSLPIVYSRSTYALYLAANLRIYTMIGYKPWYKTSYIKYTPLAKYNFGPFFRFDHVPSMTSAEKQIEILRQNKPDFLDGYPSIILEIAQKASSEDLKDIRPRMIMLNSEMSTNDQRDFIARVFNCPVYDEYSTEETWMVASQCKHKNYHLFTDNVFMEFLDKQGNDVGPGEPGELYLTTLRSPVMPFIRYRIGDIGRYTYDNCSCGCQFPIIESFDGRADDSFILPDGRLISPLKILNTFNKYIQKHLHLLEEFKVIQKTHDHVVIKLVKGNEYSQEAFREVLDSLHALLGDSVQIDVEYTNYIHNPGSIKRKAIESQLDN